MGLPSRFFEKKIFKDEKGDDITPFDGRYLTDLKQCTILTGFGQKR
jgi:hypothetical protein